MQGDLIPWTVGQQVQDPDFPSLSGVRIVRIATHPDLPRAGYGSRAVELLARFYRGELRDPAAALAQSGADDPPSEPQAAEQGASAAGNASRAACKCDAMFGLSKWQLPSSLQSCLRQSGTFKQAPSALAACVDARLPRT